MHRKVTSFLFLFALSLWSPCHAPAQDLEKRAAEICQGLNLLDPASLGRTDQSALNLIKQIEDIGPEARDAVPSLTKFATLENLVGYRAATQAAAVRTLANMGDEGVPALRSILPLVQGETLFQSLAAETGDALPD